MKLQSGDEIEVLDEVNYIRVRVREPKVRGLKASANMTSAEALELAVSLLRIVQRAVS